ncbi:DUF4199 domain-containing protein [Inhella sp.]|uniref:DUF4199 domain-containing protein n=1 Tax=Inhella sp. TaxID=1921806 RepID=UPI0035B1F382
MTLPRLIACYGLIAGLVCGLPLFAIFLLLKEQPPMPWGMVLGTLTMLLAFSAIFVAVKRHRDEQLGGVIRFLPAFLIGLGISLVATVCYVLAWEAALAVSGTDFAAEYSKAALAKAQAEGAGREVLDQMAADLAHFQALYAQPLARMGITASEVLPVGLLVSLIAAALLRNPRFLAAR